MITTQPVMHYRSNGVDPNLLSTDERLNEAARILATAIRRLLEKQKTEKIPLDNSPNQWPYGRKTTKGERR